MPIQRGDSWLAWLACAGLGLVLVSAPTPAAADDPPAPAQSKPEEKAASKPAGADAPAAGDPDEDVIRSLKAAAANRGDTKLFTNPKVAAEVFLAAIKSKDLKKIAQATALRAATESKSQKLFQLILTQELAQEDLDELAEKLAGYQIAGTHALKGMGAVGITVTKPDGNGLMRRTLTMRHEKAGWKLQDISGEGKLEAPIIVPRRGRGGRR